MSKSSEKAIIIGNTQMEYIKFGSGEKILVILPGLSESLQSVKANEFVLKRYYRTFAQDYTVYLFGRKLVMDEGYSTYDMAVDQKSAMDQLKITSAYIMGISQGGMIAQQLAINFPEVVDKLVLGVTISRPNDTVKSVISSWILMAEKGDYASLIKDTIIKTYSEEKAEKYKRAFPIITRIGKPKSFDR